MTKQVKITTAAVAAVVALALLTIFWLVPEVIRPRLAYNDAVELMQNGDYDEAVAAFTALGDYGDVAARIAEVDQYRAYEAAEARLAAQDFTGAIEGFTALGSFRDAPERLQESLDEQAYTAAEDMLADGKYQNANAAFLAISGYKDADARAQEALNAQAYSEAGAFVEAGDYHEAIALLSRPELAAYKDSPARLAEAVALMDEAYARAEVLLRVGKYEEAMTAFGRYRGYQDVDARIEEARNLLEQDNTAAYTAAEALLAEGKYDAAAAAFEKLGNYRFAFARVPEVRELQEEARYADQLTRLQAGESFSQEALTGALGDILQKTLVVRGDANPIGAGESDNEMLVFAAYKFEDADLQKNVSDYMKGIQKEAEALQYEGTDTARYGALWWESTLLRAPAVVNFQNLGLISLPEEIYTGYAGFALQDRISDIFASRSHLAFVPSKTANMHERSLSVENHTLARLENVVLKTKWNDLPVTTTKDVWEPGETWTFTIQIPSSYAKQTAISYTVALEYESASFK